MVKKLKKQFETPNEGWNEERMQEEVQLQEEYGLKNKEEVYKAQSRLRKLRREARSLVASENEKQKQELLTKANNLGLVKQNAEIEDILTLSVTDILNRRLQTAVSRKGYSETVNDARQKVVHGHVYVNGKKINIPGYLLTKEEEKKVEVQEPETKDESQDENKEAKETEQEDENQNEGDEE